MDSLTAVRQLLLYGHLLAFAFAFATVVREDITLLRARRIDAGQLRRTARQILILLIVLWASGISLLVLEGGLNLVAWFESPKIAAKITIVSLLSLNGVLLHYVAFPLLTTRRRSPRLAAFVCTVIGAASAAGWGYASFLGVARLIAPSMTYPLYLLLFLAVLALALVVALVLIRPRLIWLLSPDGIYRPQDDPAFAVEQALRKTLGRAASLLLDQRTRQAYRHDPVAYARILADRIPATATEARERFLRRVALAGRPSP